VVSRADSPAASSRKSKYYPPTEKLGSNVGPFCCRFDKNFAQYRNVSAAYCRGHRHREDGRNIVRLAHSRSSRELDRQEAAVAAELAAKRDDFEVQAAASARRVVAAWHARIAGSKAAEFFPTIRTAIISGHHRLNYYCPGCQQIGSIDVRQVADRHHQRAPISVLLPSLTCKRNRSKCVEPRGCQ
jgi:hypothetical protein